MTPSEEQSIEPSKPGEAKELVLEVRSSPSTARRVPVTPRFPFIMPGPTVGAEPPSRRERADLLYRKYGAIAYRCCVRVLRDPELARDATQEVFIKLMKNLEALEVHERAVAWVYRVATNHCLNVRRDGAREKPLEDVSDVLDLARDPSYPDKELVESILIRCDAQMRAIAVGVLVEERDHDEVAEALGISRRTVARKLQRFLEHARKFAARTGSDDRARQVEGVD